MELTPTLRRFCLAHDDAILVPAEALGQAGVDPAFADFAVAEQRLTRDQMQRLNDGFACYWKRCATLFEKAPGSWFPPRPTNLLIVGEPRGIVPNLEAFQNTSSLLYRSDLDTDAEYVAYLLAHMERLALLRSARAATICNLSYWFEADTASRAAFAAAARRAQRPDAAGFTALADALDWVDGLVHIPLNNAGQPSDEPHGAIEGADLYVPQSLQPRLAALAAAVDASIREAMQATAPRSPRPTGQPSAQLIEWLQDTRAPVIITTPDGSTVWRPNMDNPSRLRRAIDGASDEAMASMHADLKVIDTRSRQFLSAVRDVESLPRSCPVLEEGSGAWVDPSRRAIVYELKQPNYDTRIAVAPPYSRLMLGARTMHEWGHVAHTAKILRVPDERKPAYRDARAELGETFAAVVARLPAHVREGVAQETAALAREPAALPAALARKTLARVGDYLANLMSAQFIPAEEMQAYVRTNVTHHLDEDLGIVSELARYAYEVHYLGLAGLARSYFLATSRYANYYIESGLVSAEDTHALFDAAGRVLGCYEIDTTRLELPAATAAAA